MQNSTLINLNNLSGKASLPTSSWPFFHFLLRCDLLWSSSEFFREKTGIRIILDKCLLDYDDFATKFMTSKDKKAQEKVLKEAQDKLSKLTKEQDKKSADIYIKLMQKVIERGSKFLESENVRVKNIMGGKLSQAKKDEMQVRLNILQSFIPAQKLESAKSEL